MEEDKDFIEFRVLTCRYLHVSAEKLMDLQVMEASDENEPSLQEVLEEKHDSIQEKINDARDRDSNLSYQDAWRKATQPYYEEDRIRRLTMSFVVQLYGMDTRGKRYTAYVHNFRPYFFVLPSCFFRRKMTCDRCSKSMCSLSEVDRLLNPNRYGPCSGCTHCNIIGQSTVDTFVESLQKKMDQRQAEEAKGKPSFFRPRHSAALIAYRIVFKRKLYYFDNEKLYPFIELRFQTLDAFQFAEKVCQTMKKTASGNSSVPHIEDIYESNLPPLYRFFHLRNLNPTGWLRVAKESVLAEEEKEKDATTLVTTTPLQTWQKAASAHSSSTSLEEVNVDHIFHVDYENVEALPNKEDPVPLLIASFDCEASSSHGDFPMAKKTYSRLAEQIAKYRESTPSLSTPQEWKSALYQMVRSALLPSSSSSSSSSSSLAVDQVFLKTSLTLPQFERQWASFAGMLADTKTGSLNDAFYAWKEANAEILACQNMEYLENPFLNKLTAKTSSSSRGNGEGGEEEDDKGGEDSEEEEEEEEVEELVVEEEEEFEFVLVEEEEELVLVVEEEEEKERKEKERKEEERKEAERKEAERKEEERKEEERMVVPGTVMELFATDAWKGNTWKKNAQLIDFWLSTFFPQVQGDALTMIGTTFLRYGEKKPCLQLCFVVGECSPVDTIEIISCKTEREMLIRWTQAMQTMNPDIWVGYNIQGFDEQFMFFRAEENDCLKPFLSLSRDRKKLTMSAEDEVSGVEVRRKGEPLTWQLEQSVVKVATGSYDLRFFSLSGRVQIDMLPYYRKKYQLPCYKLDFVSSEFIRDEVKRMDWVEVEEEEKGEKGEKKGEEKGEKGRRRCLRIESKDMAGLTKDCFLHFAEKGNTIDFFGEGAKFRVSQLNADSFVLSMPDDVMKAECLIALEREFTQNGKKFHWCLAKDDVTLQQMFSLAQGSPNDRAVVAKYCAQDCNLVLQLFTKSDVWTEMAEMSGICSVPVDVLLMRGQTIKLQSLISRECRDMGFLIPTLSKALPILDDADEQTEQDKEKGPLPPPHPAAAFRKRPFVSSPFIAKNQKKRPTREKVEVISKVGQEGFEGATVLTPKVKFYQDLPIPTLDYASLYPSILISENYSPDTLVYVDVYKLTGEDAEGVEMYRDLRTPLGNVALKNMLEADLLPEYEFVVQECGTFVFKQVGKTVKKVKTGKKVCWFAQKRKGTDKGVFPAVLTKLLAKRKATRKLIPHQKTEFMKNVLEMRQLALKMSANSIYGASGASVSKMRSYEVAACTTSTGRCMLNYGKEVIEQCFKDRIIADLVDVETHLPIRPFYTNAEYIYGDTDSVFFTFNLHEADKKTPIKGKESLAISILLAKRASEIASQFLKAPHEFEYEKTFDPLWLLSKKRYVGVMYTDDVVRFYRKEMGVALKRRDNCPIVKEVYGGVIDATVEENGSLLKALDFFASQMKLFEKKAIPIKKLIISKSIRDVYKKPETVAHKMLADRMGERDPGNRPKAGDRIPFVFIEVPRATPTQKIPIGSNVETPEYVEEHQLALDYRYYVTNQVMKPVRQLFTLVLDDYFALTGVDVAKKQAEKRKFIQDKEISTLKRHKVSKVSELKKSVRDNLAKAEEKWKNSEVEKALFAKTIDALNPFSLATKGGGNHPVGVRKRKAASSSSSSSLPVGEEEEKTRIPALLVLQKGGGVMGITTDKNTEKKKKKKNQTEMTSFLVMGGEGEGE